MVYTGCPKARCFQGTWNRRTPDGSCSTWELSEFFKATCGLHSNLLVVLTILKNMKVNGKDDIPYMKWKIKNV
jgi:hypothetical protein